MQFFKSPPQYSSVAQELQVYFYPHKLCYSGMLFARTMFRAIMFHQHSEVLKLSGRPLLQANKHTHAADMTQSIHISGSPHFVKKSI
jgi:hypothetical protein